MTLNQQNLVVPVFFFFNSKLIPSVQSSNMLLKRKNKSCTINTTQKLYEDSTVSSDGSSSCIKENDSPDLVPGFKNTVGHVCGFE